MRRPPQCRPSSSAPTGSKRPVLDRWPHRHNATYGFPSTLELGGIAPDHIQERGMDLQVAIVGNEPELAELVHEGADARPRRADHLGERLVADLGQDRFRPRI